MAFEDTVFDGLELVWPALLPGMWKRTLSIFSLSKGYALSGLRIGYLVADVTFLDPFLGALNPLRNSVSPIIQAGAAAALEDEALLSNYRKLLQERRDRTFEILSQIPRISMVLPQAGTQLWVNISRLGSGKEVARYLRETKKILVFEGAGYGPLNGEGHIRIQFASIADDSRYYQAIQDISDALTNYPVK